MNVYFFCLELQYVCTVSIPSRALTHIGDMALLSFEIRSLSANKCVLFLLRNMCYLLPQLSPHLYRWHGIAQFRNTSFFSLEMRHLSTYCVYFVSFPRWALTCISHVAMLCFETCPLSANKCVFCLLRNASFAFKKCFLCLFRNASFAFKKCFLCLFRNASYDC